MGKRTNMGKKNNKNKTPSPKAKDKKALRKQQIEEAKARDATVRVANSRTDLLDDVAAFCSYTTKDELAIELEFVAEPSTETLDWCFGLLAENMEEIYEEDWEPEAKRRELRDDDTRIILARQGGEPVAFMHIRFLFEEGVEVLYLYELQLHKSMQRKGLGQRMMQVAELVARKNGMKGLMLTTFKNNPPATAFYNKLKYNISPISPSWVNPLGAEEYTYEIMAKIFCEEASQTLMKAAEACRQEWVEDGIDNAVDQKGSYREQLSDAVQGA